MAAAARWGVNGERKGWQLNYAGHYRQIVPKRMYVCVSHYPSVVRSSADDDDPAPIGWRPAGLKRDARVFDRGSSHLAELLDARGRQHDS